MNTGVPIHFEQALAAAIHAPSPHNTQPWRFGVDDEQIDLWLERDRILTVADPDAAEARLSCGAALLDLTLSLRVQGHLPAMHLLPQPDKPDLLAMIRIDGKCKPSRTERSLAAAIEQRHTNRRPFLEQPVPAEARSALASIATADGGRLEFLDASGHYDDVSALVRHAEFLQESDQRFRAETAHWMHRAAQSRDGIPMTAQGPPPQSVGAVTLRESHTNKALPARPFPQEPLLAAVLTHAQGPRADLQAGMIMQRVLLMATSIGLATGFLSQPFETPGTRAALDHLFGDLGHIHALLRIGYGTPVPTTARRPVSEVSTPRSA